MTSEPVISNIKSNQHPQNKTSHTRVWRFMFFIVIITILAGVIVLVSQFKAPNNLQETRFEIESGMSVQDITKKADAEGIVRSDLLLYAVLNYFYDPTKIQAGTYFFSGTESVLAVAKKLAFSETDDELIRLTIPEGMRVRAVASLAAEILPEFSIDEYIQQAEEHEGYLFPETYFVPDTFTASNLIELQMRTLEEATRPLLEDIANSGFTEYEILIFASILEREGDSEESQKVISGILQNRLRINMPLQADASIEYILNKPLKELVPEDLKIDSPYNTYTNLGLPPTPIGNPGLSSIKAVLYPTASDYFYYITDSTGTFHYAETYEQHLQNIEIYLR